jgi:hypothetical protein
LSASLPVADVQFWVVTAVAVAALLFFLRRKFRFRKKGEVELPCDNCSQARAHRNR